MCGARLALCSAPNAHPFKKLYGRTLRVAVFFCLLRSPFAQPRSALPPILVCKTIKTACNASPSSASSYQNRIVKHPPAHKVQHYGCSSARKPATAMHCGSTLDGALHDLHPGCFHLPVMHSGRTASARVCNHLGHQQTMHKAPSPRSLGRTESHRLPWRLNS